jgi:2-desacetyl-2-hydroxyethyl bacteriochlorophyllide A dehydrogenase
MKVKAALIDRDLTMRIGERELPAPGPGAVLVKVDWAGLCGSDLHAIHSGDWITDWPATLGHEVFGHVEAVGEGVELPLGAPVVLDSRLPCLECEACAEDPDRCTQVTFLGESRPGGFATHVVVPLRSVHRVPADVQGEDAVLAEPLAVAFHTMAKVSGRPRSALVLGHGPVGALAHIELRRRFPDAAVTVAEPAAHRRELAVALGAERVESAAALPAAGFDLVIDAAGYPEAFADAVRLVADGGQILLVAIAGRPATVDGKAIVERRISIVGVSAFVDELPAAIAALSEEPWRYRPVVTDAIGLDELPEAIESDRARKSAIKLLVRP